MQAFTRITAILILTIGPAACGGGGGSNSNNAPPANVPPSASISVSKTSGYAPLTLTFDASSSSDNDGSVTGYLWDFGDGFTSQEVSVDHIFFELGNYDVVLTVTDNSGATSSSQISINVHGQAAGFYLGTTNSTTTGNIQGILVHIGSDKRLFARAFTADCVAGYSGTIDVSMTTLSGTLLADTFDQFNDLNCVFADGSVLGDVNVSGTVAPRSSISATYDGVGDVGVIQIEYIPEVSERQPSLANLSGVWSASDESGFTETMTIQPDGQFAASSSDGCNYTGTFALIDPRLNEFEIIYDLSCPPGISAAGDGQRIGLAFVDDVFFPDEWLVWDVIFQEGPLAGSQGVGALSRPRSSSMGIDNSAEKVGLEWRNFRSKSRIYR